MIAQQSIAKQTLRTVLNSFLCKAVELEAHVQSIARIKDQVRIIGAEPC